MRSVSKNMRCCKKAYLPKFSKLSLATLLHIVNGKKWFVWESSISKILGDTLFYNTAMLAIFLNEGQLRPPIARPKHFWANFGNFWGREPNLYSKISDFDFDLVFLFFCLYQTTLCAIYIDNIFNHFYHSRTTSKFGGFWDWNLRLILQCVV